MGWVKTDCYECDRCGSPAEVIDYKDSPEILFEGQGARCSKCHYPGNVSVSGEDVWIEWHSEGYAPEAADRIDNLLDLLEQAVCPNDCINGYYIVRTDFEGGSFRSDGKPCEWCARVKEILEGE